MAEPKLPVILIVDDEPKSCKYFAKLFQKQYEVIAATTANEASEIVAERQDVSIVLADQRMPDRTGIDLFKELKVRNPRIIRILTTAFEDYSVLVDAINEASVYAYLDKPWNMDQVSNVLTHAVLQSAQPSIAPQLTIPLSTNFHPTSRLRIDFGDIDDVATLLKLCGIHLRENHPSAQAFATLQRDGDKYFACVHYGEERLNKAILTLADLKAKLSSSAPVDRKGEKQELPVELPKLESLKDQPTETTSTSLSRIQIAQRYDPIINLTMHLQQIQIYLSGLRNKFQFPQAPLLNPYKDVIILSRFHVEDLLRDIRSIITSDALIHEKKIQSVRRVSEDVFSFLDSLNQVSSRERKAYEAVQKDPRIVNGLFVHYNQLAGILNLPIISPEPDLNSTDTASPRTALRTFQFGAVFLIFTILFLSIMIVLSFYGPPDAGFSVSTKYLIVSLLALTAGGSTGFLGGWASIEGKLPAPLTQSPIRIGATSGIAVFFVTFLFGLLFFKWLSE